MEERRCSIRRKVDWEVRSIVERVEGSIWYEVERRGDTVTDFGGS